MLEAQDQLTRERAEAGMVEVLVAADVMERRGAMALTAVEEEGVQSDERRLTAPLAADAGMAVCT